MRRGYRRASFLAATILIGACGTNARADDLRVKCAQFTSMPADEQVTFTAGMLNGVGMLAGVMDTFDRILSKKASNYAETTGIHEMHTYPLGFLRIQSCCAPTKTIAEKLAGECRASPDAYVANFLTDVLSGRAK